MRLLKPAIGVTATMLACAPRPSTTVAVPGQVLGTIEWSEAPRRVRGIVADSLGRPVERVLIAQSICPAGSAAPCYDSPSVVACSDASGRFSFELPKDGEYIVVAMINGFFVGHGRIAIPRDAASILRLTASGVDRARSAQPASQAWVNRANDVCGAAGAV